MTVLPDVLLLPGLLCDQRLWAAQVEALAASACCRIPDLADCASISAMADAMLDQAPSRFTLAGFSMGGCVALEVVGLAPERVGRLALLSTAAQGLLPPVRERLQESILAIKSGGLDAYLADAFPSYVSPDRAHDPDLWRTFAAMGLSLGPAVAVRQMQALLAYPGFQGDLGRIGCRHEYPLCHRTRRSARRRAPLAAGLRGIAPIGGREAGPGETKPDVAGHGL
jgi:pimeloyl-ACP methyl ester carboxylesterase